MLGDFQIAGGLIVSAKGKEEIIFCSGYHPSS
jgi:hypothetical protein